MTESHSSKAVFRAILDPNPYRPAIQLGEDGMTVRFEIPETDLDEALKLRYMRHKVLRVTVEVVDDRQC